MDTVQLLLLKGDRDNKLQWPPDDIRFYINIDLFPKTPTSNLVRVGPSSFTQLMPTRGEPQIVSSQPSGTCIQYIKYVSITLTEIVWERISVPVSIKKKKKKKAV